MKISFVIPAYNEERYIGSCLEAIAREAASFRDRVEVIVVDNASKDGTARVVRQHSGVRLVPESKKGIVWARQAGFAAATGDLIANVDADTRLTKNWVKKVLKAFEKNPDLVAMSGPCI